MTVQSISIPPTRRNILGHAVGAIAATAVLSAMAQHSAETKPDAVLLANAAEALRLDRESFALTIDLPHDDPHREENYTAARAMVATYHAITAAVCMMPAETVQGLMAKAELARSTILLGHNDEPDPDDRIMWSVLADLERMFGGRAVA